ncbi:MAG: hemerythrin family protein [Methylophaga sp.]|nr:hemerythrin family protein [Methylophaga sp.]
MSSTKVVLTAETVPHVALDIMNNTHFEELELVRSLGELITHYQQGDNDILSQALNEWLEHTQTHFSRENKLMVDIQFPMYLVHSGEHAQVLEEMESIVTSWNNDHDIALLSEYVFTAWPQWFQQHVNSMDMVTAQFAVMNGYDPHKSAQD